MGNVNDEKAEIVETKTEFFEFVNVKEVKWIRSGNFLVILDYVNEKGVPLALTLKSEALSKAMDYSF